MKSSLLKGWEMLDMILMMVLVGVVAYLFFWRNYYVLSNGDNVSVVSWLWHAWRTDPDSEHGMLVPLISAGLLWWRREEILRCSRQKNAYFAGFIILGSFIYILGAGGGVSSLGPMALILWFLGVIGFIGGAALFKQTLFPIGFLAFMIPWSLIGGGHDHCSSASSDGEYCCSIAQPDRSRCGEGGNGDSFSAPPGYGDSCGSAFWAGCGQSLQRHPIAFCDHHDFGSFCQFDPAHTVEKMDSLFLRLPAGRHWQYIPHPDVDDWLIFFRN